MPSSAPYSLRIQKRRVRLVLPDRERSIRPSRRATDKDKDKGAVDVISRSEPTLNEAPTHVDPPNNHDPIEAFPPASSSLPRLLSSPSPEMSLNPEPSVPDEREEQDLPPKSYADAAEEAITPVSHVSNGSSKKSHKAKSVENVQTNGRIHIPTDEETQEYEGSGQDNSPKSPTRGHKRKTSSKSNGSIGRKHGEQLKNEVKNEVYEKHENSNGKPLTSVKPPKDVEKDTPGPDAPKRRDSTLMSGRQAGAGWQKSKYVYSHFATALSCARC